MDIRRRDAADGLPMRDAAEVAARLRRWVPLGGVIAEAWSAAGRVVGHEGRYPACQFDEAGLPPSMSPEAWRCNVPVYKGARQVGRATSGTWSPTLKRNIALATVEASEATPGNPLSIDWQVDWRVRRAPCVVADTPFFDPPRKRA